MIPNAEKRINMSTNVHLYEPLMIYYIFCVKSGFAKYPILPLFIEFNAFKLKTM